MSELKRLPANEQEFQERYLSNNTVENEGTASEVRHLPCIFCGAPDMVLLRALRVQEDLERGGKCDDCGRGIRIVFDGDTRVREGVRYEVFQTEGDDPPDYIVPKPRRVS